MLGTALLVFREVLEASLIVSVVCAATRGVARRGTWVAGGIAAGVLGSVLLAVFAGAIGSAINGVGQELFNACVLLAAVAMIGWHAIWMANHGRQLTLQTRTLGSSVSSGERPLAALFAVVAIAVLREGSESVLFVYAQSANGSDVTELSIAVSLGLLSGVATGVGLYLGLLRIPTRHFFTTTNWLLVLVAAGMAAQAARFFLQADLLPPLGPTLWDTSTLLSDHSVVGQALHVLVGYDARPAGLQVLFYVATAAFILFGMKVWGRQKPPRAPG